MPRRRRWDRAGRDGGWGSWGWPNSAALRTIPEDQILARVTCFARSRNPVLVAVVTTGGQLITAPVAEPGAAEVAVHACRCLNGHLIRLDHLRAAVEAIEHHRATARRIDVIQVDARLAR